MFCIGKQPCIVADNISWTESKGFPYAGTCIGLDEVTRIVFSRLGSERIDYKFTPEDYVAGDNKMVAYGNTQEHIKKQEINIREFIGCDAIHFK